MMAAPAVQDIRVRRAARCMDIVFSDGIEASLPAEYLRVESPSAEVQGHGPGQKRIIAGKRAVNIQHVEAVGHYAVRIRFTDGHDTGLYSWDVLYALALEQAARWSAYLGQIDALGLSRDPE